MNALIEPISAGIFVPHPRVKGLLAKIDDLRLRRRAVRDPSEIRHLMVPGDTGMGKTLTAQYYLNQNPPQYGDESDIRPVDYLEMPSPFAVRGFYADIIHSLGVPLASTRMTSEELFNQAVFNLQAQRVEVLIIDEMNHIAGSTISPTKAMEAIKHLANKSGVVLVFLGTKAILNYRKLDPQYFRRFWVYHLEPYDKVDQEFCEFLYNLGRRLGFAKEAGLGDTRTGVPQTVLKLTAGQTWRVAELLSYLSNAQTPAGQELVSSRQVEAAHEKWLSDRGDEP